MKIIVTLKQHDLKNAAMVAAGIDPRAMALKPGKRVHIDRKKAAARGQLKHKGRQFD